MLVQSNGTQEESGCGSSRSHNQVQVGGDSSWRKYRITAMLGKNRVLLKREIVNSKMIIREVEEQDRSDTVALWRSCGLVSPQNDLNKDIDRKLKVDSDLFLVGTQNGKIVATVMGGYEGHRGWINYLGVHPDYRNQGFGATMMGAVEERLRAKGCPKINLQVRNTNTQVIEFYQSLGFGDDSVIGLGKRLEED